MRIKRPLPPAPEPTRPQRINKQEYNIAEAIDANTIEIFVSDRDSTPAISDKSKKQAARQRGLATIGAARAAAMENARKRALPILEHYKNGMSTAEIMQATGMSRGSVLGVIGRYTKSGEIQVTPSREDLKLAELYKTGMSYNEMSEALGISGGSLSGKLARIRRMGLIGKRER